VTNRVLVVDDDTALAEMLGIVLRAEGFEPVFCTDGDQALAIFRESKPDIVLLDVMMPGIDGFELTRQVRANPAWSDLPVLMITSSDDKREQAEAAGVTQLLGKPYSEEALIAAIERARLAVRVPA